MKHHPSHATRSSARSAIAVTSIVAMAATTLGVAPAAAVDVPSTTTSEFEQGFYVPFNNLLVADQGAAGVVANGNLAVSWSGSQFDGALDADDQLDSFDADVGFRGAVTLELAAETSGDVNGTIELLSVPLGQFTTGPATVTPYLGVNVRVSGAAEAGAKLSVVAPFDADAAFLFDDGVRSATAAERPTFRPEVGLPDAANALAFEATVELELTLTFMVSIQGFPIGGPTIVAGLGATVTVDALDDPWWRVDATTRLKWGWSMPDALGAPQPPRRLTTLARRQVTPIAQAGTEDTGPVGDVSTRWSRTFDIDGYYDSAGAVVPVGNGLVVVEDSSRPWLTTLDGLGNPTWQQQDDRLLGHQAIARTESGSVLVAGGVGSGDLRVVRYAADGALEWSKILDIAGSTSATWSTITPTDAGLIISGGSRRGVSVTERPTLIALDHDGELLWANEIDPGRGSGDASIAEVVETPDGDLLAVGTVEYEVPDRSIDQSNALIMRIRRDGTPVSAQVVGGPFLENVTGVAMQTDGAYAITGRSVVGVNDDNTWVASFDAGDRLLWSALYADRADNAYATATGIAAVAGGDYVVSGTTLFDPDAFLMRIDSSGMPVWSKSFVGTDTDQLLGVVAMPTGVAAFGRTETTVPSGSYDDLWIVRTNVDGMVDFDDASGFETVNGAVQWTRTSEHVQLELSPAGTAMAVGVDDDPIDVTPASATNTLLAR